MDIITIRIRGTTAENTADARIVCGNTGYQLLIAHDGTFSGEKDIILTLYSPAGNRRETTLHTYGDTVMVPAVADCYLIAVAVQMTDGSAATTQSAIIRCTACITDDAGAEDTPPLDIYNLACEYLHSMDTTILDTLRNAEIPAAFPGAAYSQAIKQAGRPTELTAEVTVNGTTTELADDQIALGSFRIACSAMASDYLLPGGTPSAELTLSATAEHAAGTLGAEIAPVYRIQRQNEHWCEIPLGVFTVASVDKETESAAKIVAYDDMRKFERVPFDHLGFTRGTAYTPQEIITACAEAAGVEYEDDVTSLINGAQTYRVSEAAASIGTARDLVSFVAQTLCAVAVIDRFRKLRIRPLGKTDPVDTVTGVRRFSSRISQTQYRLYQLTTVLTLPGTDGAETVINWSQNTLWPDGVEAELPENPLWGVIESTMTPRAAATQCLNRIVAALDPITMYPVELEYPGDPALELLDWMQAETDAAEFPVTETNWMYHGRETVLSRGFEAIAGLAKSQAEKAALAARMSLAENADNIMRLVYLRTMQSYIGLKAFTYREISHYTYNELGGRTL